MLRLLKANEKVDYQIGGTTFTLVLQSHGAARALRVKHSKRGRVDEEAMAAEFWRTYLVGWKDLANADGQPAPFSEGTIIDVVNALPDDVVSLLTAKIREPQLAVQEALQG